MGTILHIPIELSMDFVQQKLRPHDREMVAKLVEEVLSLTEAQALFTSGYVKKTGETHVVIDGRSFKSRVLRKNLEGIGRVFPAVITIGDRLEERIDQGRDLLDKYYLDAIGNLVLSEARSKLTQHLCRRFAIDKLSWISPGSLEDWPLEAQRTLFDLFEGEHTSIGVELTESLLMLPRKSVSGIFFPSETTFFSCRLCPRERCDQRKARYDKSLARSYGILK